MGNYVSQNRLNHCQRQSECLNEMFKKNKFIITHGDK